jgi:hypothetical protein
MIDPNPPRKCGGSKMTNAFYAEGGDLSPDGSLYPWTWLLGNGISETIFLEIPPRQIQLLNPILTVLFKAFMPPSGPRVPIPEDKRWLYDHLTNAMKTPGIGDHVGAQYYTPWNFAAETAELAASRRISPQMAKALGIAISTYGPLPMMFTHNEIPAFRHEAEVAAMMLHVSNCMDVRFDELYHQSTWTHDNWGMYARRGQWVGNNHFMIPVLWFLDELRLNWKKHKDKDCWKKAKKFFRGIRFTEQTFGLSWLCKVTYTMPGDNNELDEETLEILENIPGINVLDLAQLNETAEVEHEKVEN